MTETINLEQTDVVEQDSKFKTIFIKTASFLKKHESKILGGAVVITTTAAVLMRLGLNEHDKFLTEKGLYDEYYDPDGLFKQTPVIEKTTEK